MKGRKQNQESFDAQLAAREALGLAQSLSGQLKPLGSLNVIAPNLKVNIYWGSKQT